MSDAYHQLLEATIQHLQELKTQGVRFVPVSAETLAALAAPRHSGAVAAKAPVPRPAGAAFQPELSSPGLAGSRPRDPNRAHEPPGPGGAAAAAPGPVSAVSPAKAAAFAELRRRATACTRCAHLVAARRNVVFGVGSIDARLMFVGEAPGVDEDEQGEPFVGKAGQLLTKIIRAMGLSRGSVYIANILKCRPDTPGQAAGNRKPTPQEMQTCLPYLHEQIDLIQPEVIIALGATAVEGLLGKTLGITRLRGNWRSYRGIPLMPTYHPAYLLRNQALGERRRVWEDMLEVMAKLNMAISEKQRNYFLKSE